jgi:hypothetical protein
LITIISYTTAIEVSNTVVLITLDLHQTKFFFLISTTQNSQPYENAIAERINGILKYEFGLRKKIASVDIARKIIKQAVEIYNNQRLHWSLDLKTPQMVHNSYNQQQYKSYKRNA